MLIRLLRLQCRTSTLSKPFPKRTALSRLYTSRTSNIPPDLPDPGGLVASLTRFLSYVEDRKHVSGYLDRKLGKFRSPSKSEVMEKCIEALLRKRFFDEATALYQKMANEGFTPSARMDSYMLVMVLDPGFAPGIAGMSPAQEKATQEGVKETLNHLFRTKFTDEDAEELMTFMRTFGIPTDHLVTIMESYFGIKTAQLDYVPSGKLLNAYAGIMARAGKVDEAIKSVMKYGAKLEEAEEKRDSLRDLEDIESDPSESYPYVNILANLVSDAYTPSESASHTDKVLGVVRDAQFAIDNSLFNVLISQAVEAKDREKAFKIYWSLLEIARAYEGQTQSPASADKNIPTRSIFSPDEYTYRNLFKVLRNLGPLPTTEYDVKSQAKIIVSPRRLFFHMLALYFIPELHRRDTLKQEELHTSMKTTQSLLLTALKTFLSLRDYSAAMVTIQAHRAVGVDINIAVYRCVMLHIIKRMRRNPEDTRTDEQITIWKKTFLGDKEAESFDDLLLILLNKMSPLQALGDSNEPSESSEHPSSHQSMASLYSRRKRRAVRPVIPTLNMLNLSPSTVDVDEQDYFNTALGQEPLERMIVQAGFAHRATGLQDMNEYGDAEFTLGQAAFIIREARKNMLPNDYLEAAQALRSKRQGDVWKGWPWNDA